MSVVSELFSGMYHVNQKSFNKLYQFDICSMPCSEPLGDIDNVRSVLQHAKVGIAVGSSVAQCLILSDQTLLDVLTGGMTLDLASKYGMKLFGIYDMQKGLPVITVILHLPMFPKCARTVFALIFDGVVVVVNVAVGWEVGGKVNEL